MSFCSPNTRQPGGSQNALTIEIEWLPRPAGIGRTKTVSIRFKPKCWINLPDQTESFTKTQISPLPQARSVFPFSQLIDYTNLAGGRKLAVVDNDMITMTAFTIMQGCQANF
jgi:hypothetical protein